MDQSLIFSIKCKEASELILGELWNQGPSENFFSKQLPLLTITDARDPITRLAPLLFLPTETRYAQLVTHGAKRSCH